MPRATASEIGLAAGYVCLDLAGDSNEHVAVHLANEVRDIVCVQSVDGLAVDGEQSVACIYLLGKKYVHSFFKGTNKFPF